jgi:SsrA-binding protein
MVINTPALERVICEHRRARYNYEILETFLAGLVLQGSEVKSLRAGHAHLNQAYAAFSKGELWLIGAHIAPWQAGGGKVGFGQHEPTRSRKILLKYSELKGLRVAVQQKGLTLVPLKLVLGRKGLVKLVLALGRGKKTVDKRATIKEREQNVQLRRILKGRK